MSADFLCAAIEFPKIKHPTKKGCFVQPDWKKSVKYIHSLSERQLAVVYNKVFELDLSEDDSDYEEGSSFVSAIQKSTAGRNVDVEEIIPNLHSFFVLEVVEFCRELWDGNSHGTSIELHKSFVLIAGQASWGDEPQGFKEIELFAASGAARAAGFVHVTKMLKPEKTK